jgi:hypothetical protein
MSSDTAGAGGPDPAATIEAWRARGLQHADPVRFRFIEALARRASAHEGEARRVLDARLAGLLAAYGEGRDRTAGQVDKPATHTVTHAAPAASPGPLAGLVADIARQSAPLANAAARPGAAPVPGLPPELKALQHFRKTWSRLHAEQRLAQSRARLPENAGPLNSHQLVHRGLTLMRSLSPEYLDHFMGHVDALLALEQLLGQAPGGRERGGA